MTEPVGSQSVDTDPDLPRAARRLSLLFAGQLLAMLLILAGGILLMVTFAHNNDLNCTSGFASFGSASPCQHRSYVLPIVLLVAGFGWFLVGMALSAAIGMRTGASVLDTFLKRRR